MTESFWGKIPDTESMATPCSILAEQGEHLAKQTDGLLKGVVTRGNHSGKVIIDFHIEVPALDNYRYQLARVLHDVVLYPAVIQQNGITAAECRSEHAFKEALKSILASEGTSRIVQSLLAQAKDGTGDVAAEPGAA